MCFGSTPTPAAPAPPTPPKDPPTKADPAVKQARDDERQRAALAAGRQGTVLTGGVTAPANTTRNQLKTALGQ